jgi:hypothetical protein
MPLLNVVNVSTSEVVISDPKKAFPTISVLAGATKNGIKILGKELESAGPVLKRLVDAGKITFSTAQDPDVPDNTENLMGEAAVADDAVTTVKILDANVTTAKLAAAAVTKAKAAVFFSAELAATGAAQNVAHGLGVVPAAVLIVPTQGHNAAGAAGEKFTNVVAGTHTTTNVVVTAEAGGKFKVMAWA